MIKIKFYATTSIIYTNADPHIGFALELIQADVLARLHRSKGDDVFFLTGTDEHGSKIQKAAADAGQDPDKFVDGIVEKVQEMVTLLNISNDDFIRTTDTERHIPTAQDIWKLIEGNDDFYMKKYKGNYCVGCECFKTERELVDGLCPIHNKKPEVVEEENYFFKLSKYQDKLVELIESDELKIVPKERKKEVLNFIKSGLEDISFSRSRKSLSWGIPVPGNNDQTMYVWCDALTNYLSGVGYTLDKKQFEQYWPADVHVIGKDIIRFHAVFWPAMLLSVGLPLPKEIFAHGFITKDGKKMSKTIGNVVDPIDQIKRYGADPFRYFLLRELPASNDGDYSEEMLISRINTNLAGDLGNLVYRVLTLTEKNFDGKVPKPSKGKLAEIANGLPERVSKSMEVYDYQGALDEIWKLVRGSNQYINETEPWKIEDKEKLSEIIYELLEALRFIAVTLKPFLPDSSEKIIEQLGLENEPSFSDLKWGELKEGTQVKKGEVLFQKVETE